MRGIVSGSTHRRLVAKTLARQHSDAVYRAVHPFQFALSTRAGTDAMGHLLRAVTEMEEDKVVIAIDGVGAFDHIRRARIFEKLMSTEGLSTLVPFVRLFYGEAAEYLWENDSGEVQTVTQGEGGEQGDPLMPALFSLGLHDSLAEARGAMHEDDWLGAYLDDVYLVTTRDRAREAFDTVTSAMKRLAGVDANLGKCRAWSAAGGDAPHGMAELGPEVWRCTRPANENGLVILGSPLGSDEYVAEFARRRRAEEQIFWTRLLDVPDLQCAWVLLLCCAAPRANHLLRLLPPETSQEYAAGHDADVWGAL